MHDDNIKSKQRRLEDSFLARQDERVVKKMREPEPGWSGKPVLTQVSGISDDEVLDQLVSMRLGPEGVAAVSLVPLILVAWADGELNEAEKTAIQQATVKFGLAEQFLAQQLLGAWLSAPPGKDIAEAWRAYVRTVAPKLNADGRAAVKRETVDRARAVAEAAGGFLGIGKISSAEQAVLADLEAAFGI